MKRRFGKYGISLIGILVASLNFKVSAQQYQPRIFEQPILIDSDGSWSVSLESYYKINGYNRIRKMKVGLTYIAKKTNDEPTALRYADIFKDNINLTTVSTQNLWYACDLDFNSQTGFPAIVNGRYFYFFDGSTWQSQEIVPESANIKFSSLDFSDYNNQPYVAGNSFYPDFNLHLSHYNGANWDTELLSWNDAFVESLTIFYNFAKQVHEPMIAYTTLGWTNHPTNAYIYYPKFNPPDSLIEEGSGYLGVGVHSMKVYLIIDPNTGKGFELPCVSYGDYSNKLLKYAIGDGSQWQKEVVDNNLKTNNYRYASSLTLYPNPIIVYNSTNGDLKLATKINNQWYKEIITNFPTDSKTSAFISSIDINDKIVCVYGSQRPYQGDRRGGVWLIAEKGALDDLLAPTTAAEPRWQLYK